MVNYHLIPRNRKAQLEKNIDLRLEKFGSLIYRTGHFDFMEVNHFGTLICKLIQEHPTSAEFISQMISDEYDRSISEVRDDVIHFLSDLNERGFVGFSDAEATKIPGGVHIEIVKDFEYQWSVLPDQDWYCAPLQFHWEITDKCNLGCMHCYASSTMTSDDLVDTINWEKCRSLLETLQRMKVVQINFLGGEPLIEKQFLPLLEKAGEMGFDVTFPSNGLLFNRDNLQRMKAIGMEFITISLDSADPDIFEELRGRRGVFSKVVENIRLVKEMDMGVVINAVLTKTTYRGFRDLIEFIIGLDVDILKVIDEFPVGRGLANIDRLMLSPKEYRNFYIEMIEDIEPRYHDRLEIQISPRFAIKEELEKRRNQKNDSNEVADGPNTRNGLIQGGDPINGGIQANDTVDYRCSAGRSQCFCTVDWDIYPCYLFYGERKFSTGNVLERPFNEIWNDPSSFHYFRNKMGSIPQCETCEYFSTCKGGCRGDVYKLTGGFFAGNPYCWNLERESKNM